MQGIQAAAMGTRASKPHIDDCNHASKLSIRNQLVGFQCCCNPKKHASYTECFERTVFEALIDARKKPVLSFNIPVTPSVTDLLLMQNTNSSNTVSVIMNKMLRRRNVTDITLRSAVYIILYRTLRVSYLCVSSLRVSSSLTRRITGS